MKKTLLFCCVLVAGAMRSQTIVFQDDMESYTLGAYMAEENSDNYSTWTGLAGVNDATVSDDYASSGSQSFVVDGTSVDFILRVGDYTSGKYDVIWQMYVPEGEGAYFNALHIWVGNVAADEEWATECYFSPDGSIEWLNGEGTDGGGEFPHGTWFPVQITADMDNDLGSVFVNGVMLYQWQWSLDSGAGSAGTNQFSAIDFYGASGPSGSTAGGLYYIDDVKIQESTGVGMQEVIQSTFAPAVYPNPANNSIGLNVDSSFIGGSVQILDLTGKVLTETPITAVLALQGMNVSALADGIYLVKFINSSDEFTTKMVIRH